MSRLFLFYIVLSRIEGITKEYETSILASKDTVQLTQQEFTWKSIGEVTLKGKKKSLELLHPNID